MKHQKHIVLFENFVPRLNESVGSLDSCEFTFLPYDNYKGSISFDKMNLEGLIKLSEESGEKGNAAEIGDAGVFICHIKQPLEGFTRINTVPYKSIFPLTFDVCTWNNQIELKGEDKEVPVEDLSVLVSKGKMLTRIM
jgi:hypothetical protein